MSEKNPSVAKAYKLICENTYCGIERALEALDSAGLLVTPLHDRALKVCEDIENDRAAWERRSGVRIHFGNGSIERAQDIGRESLAAKKPKERWVAKRQDSSLVREVWLVADEQGGGSFGFNFRRPLTESQARAVAAALNAEEAGRG